MRSCGLAAYTIRVKEKHAREGSEVLSQISGEFDLLNNLNDYFNERRRPAIDQRNHRLIRVTKHVHRERVIDGLMEKGEYGTREPIVNVDTFEVPHVKQRYEAALFPHYFHVEVPVGAHLGLVVLERSGQQGVFW